MDYNITNEELANYMSTVLSLKEIYDAYCLSPNSANSTFAELGNLLSKYYISTGDSSIESAKKIIQMYVEKGKNKSFIKEQYMPFCERAVAKKLNIENFDTDLLSRIKIHSFIKSRNDANSFVTHCFPGALFEGINENGLDIHKELFKEEYEILSKCFKTSFQTGNLNYCELSEASLGYATIGMPERAKFAIGANIQQNSGESKLDACSRTLKENLLKEIEKGTISQEDYYKLYEAGMHIIEFYCQSQMGCVAYWKNDKNEITPPNIEKSAMGFFSKIQTTLYTEFKDTFIERILKEVELENKKNPGNEIKNYQKAINDIIEIFPELRSVIEDIIEETFCYDFSHLEVSNLLHGGNADGYSVEGGKLSREEFAISSFKLPDSIILENIKQIQNSAQAMNQGKTEEAISETSQNKKKTIGETGSKLRMLEREFSSVINEMPEPDFVGSIGFHKRAIAIGVKDGTICVPQCKTVGKTEDGKPIYSLFSGSMDWKLTEKILGSLSDEEKEKIVEEYKKSPEYDDSFEEEDIMEWKTKKIFDGLDEPEKNRIVNEILAEAGTYTASVNNGRLDIKILNNAGKYFDYSAETIYSAKGECKYKKLFKKLLEEKMKIGREDCSEDKQLNASQTRDASKQIRDNANPSRENARKNYEAGGRD